MRERPDGARQLADGNDLACALDSSDVARELRVPERQLEAEGHRLGMDAMRPTDHRRPPMLFGARSHRLHQTVEALQDHIARFAHLQRLRGVDDVGGRETEMEPPGGRTDVLGDGGGEGDDVVLGDLFDFLDAVELKRARARMSRAASSGTIPARAIASTAASSTCSQVSYFR